MSEIATRTGSAVRLDERKRLEGQTRLEERRQGEVEQGPLLAAALAAALVEYRRYVGQRNDTVDQESNETNWRIAGRLEQLRSMA